jgi:hypothetical protein
MSEFRHASAIEPAVAPEIIATDLVSVEQFGSFVRLVFARPETSLEMTHDVQMVVTAKLVVPADCLAEIAERLKSPCEISPPPVRKGPQEKPTLVVLHRD